MLAALLLCLAMLLPALPVQPAVAAPEDSFRAQQPDQPLIAFLRHANLWLMNEDGSDRRQITISKGGVQRFAWSPSGQYIAILHESRLDLHDVATGETRALIDVQGEFPSGRSSYGSVFSWAVDADELMVITDSGGTGTFTRVSLDGTASHVATYVRPYACGGMDGPIPITNWLLTQQESGSAFIRGVYDGVIWWTDRDIAYVNTPCAPSISLDLNSGQAIEYPETGWLAAGPNGTVLIQDSMFTNARSAGVFDPATGVIQPLPIGDEGPLLPRTGLAWAPAGEVVFARVTARGDSAFTSRFDDYPIQYTDHTVDIVVTGVGAEPRLIASLDVHGIGVPSVAGDGAIIVGAVDNPTALMNVDESRYSQFSPEAYAEHQKILRIDPSGEVTVLLTNAYRPRLQPAGTPGTEAPPPAEDEPTDLTGTPAATATAEPTKVAEQPVSAGDGWIAYAGRDGNIWLSRPDGSDQRQVTIDGSPERPYIHPNWSPDGTMLVFSTRNAEEESGNDIYLLRDGAVTRVPVIHNCYSAAFTADGARLLILCAAERSSSPPSDTYPPDGLVSAVDLDGSNWEVVAPFPLEIDGSDPLWWSRLFTSDISVSPVDGEILVNSIFMSSARVPQIQLIDATGEWDAIFGAPPEEGGRVWGTFSADGTNILTRICRGCYKDSPGPPNAAILLLDREGNLLETLYTPDPNVTIGSFTQSPDGTHLLLRTTTEETDFDLGTAGLTYVTQMVDIATGTVTELPIDGGAFAWQPVAVDIAVPESTAGLQPTTQFISTAPVVAIACTTTSEGFSLSTDGPILPEGCSVAEGMRFTVSGASGEAYGQCVIGSAAFCSQPEIWMPVDVEVTVTVDESTIPDGYAVVGGNPQVFTLGSEYLNTDAAQWLIVLMPADVAAAQGQMPTGDTAEATEVATESGSASGLTIEPGQDWIAYVGDDGNIWLMQPDGSQRKQVTTDGNVDGGFPTYNMPAWSHDGTMLTFTGGGDEKSGIWVLREGELSLLPNTGASCHGPAFSADNQRVLYTCTQNAMTGDPVPSDLANNPLRGLVSSSALDGSDQRIEVPYSLDGSGVDWTSDGKAMHYGRRVDVRPSDGAIMVVYSGFHKAGVHLFASDGTLTGSFDLFNAGDMWLGPYDARLTPDGEAIIATVCTAGCFPSEGEPIQDVLLVDLNGNVVGPWTQSDPGYRFAGVDISPDGSRVVAAVGSGSYTDGTIVVYQAPMQPATIGFGLSPAWQPDPDVAMERPASTGPTTTLVPAASSGSVPSEFIATWSGRGVQENPYGEWAVTISITGGGIGEVVGTSEYPEESCGGNLILQEVTADAIVLLEQLTYGQETCADNGTITLSDIDNVAIQFDWSGIGPYGTPSTAGGTLFRPDSATGASVPSGGSMAAPSGDQSHGPAQDTTQLHPDYIGTYSGTGNQTDPDNQWPITVIFTGGRPGEVIGTVEYPTLGCGGELILVSINPVDEWRGFKVTERITYGHDNCIDGGTFAFSSAESGIGITFGWTSPVSATRASGHLPEVDPGDAPAPADQSTEASGAGQGIEPAGGDASGGPPSIYDDAEAEPVPIEAEGG